MIAAQKEIDATADRTASTGVHVQKISGISLFMRLRKITALAQNVNFIAPNINVDSATVTNNEESTSAPPVSERCRNTLMSAMGGKRTFTVLAHAASMPRPTDPDEQNKWAGCLPALLVVSLLTGFVVSCERRDERLAADHPSVRPGTSKAEAIAALGTPSWEGKCDSKAITPLKAGCASELGYSSWLAPLKPVYRVVQLDNHGRVISSDFVASP
jgi:hypothetical protein